MSCGKILPVISLFSSRLSLLGVESPLILANKGVLWDAGADDKFGAWNVASWLRKSRLKEEVQGGFSAKEATFS